MKILFNGDSVTDANGDRTDYHYLSGYSRMVAEVLGDKNEYLNSAKSGDTSKMVLDRFDTDIKQINPDLMTLLVGINDVWRRFDSGKYTSADEYENNLREIISKTKKYCRGCKVILLEPYLLPAEDKKYFRPTLIEFIDRARKVAIEMADGFIPLDGLFAKECITMKWSDMSVDGIHPTVEGQKIIAKYLVEEMKKFSI